MPSTETAPHVRGSIALAPHVQDAIERAHEITQDCLRYLHDDVPTTKAARRAKAAVAHDQAAALQALPSLVGRTFTRTTSSGRILSITITRRHLAAIKACVDAIYGLAKKWSAVNERVEPIVPLTRPLAAQMASQLFETSMRTWTKWLPWLHIAGVVVYQHGSHNHPSLVALPTLYRAHVRECRDVVKGRFADGFTRYLDDAEVARRGRWWEPVCATLLDEISDVHERAAAFADHLLAWCERARGAAAKKQAAILEALVKRAGDGAHLAAARALERAKLVKERLKASYEQKPPTTDFEFAARRSALNDAERSVMAADARVKAAANEAVHSGVQAIVALGQKALGQASTPANLSSARGGGTKLHRNDLQDYFVVLEGKNARATPAKPIQAPAAQQVSHPTKINPTAVPAAPEAGQGQVRAAINHGDDSPTSLAYRAGRAVAAAKDPAAALFAIFAPKRSADAR